MINSYFRKYEYKIQKYSWVKGWGVGWQLQRFRESLREAEKKVILLLAGPLRLYPPKA